jgi:hypothetical protein
VFHVERGACLAAIDRDSFGLVTLTAVDSISGLRFKSLATSFCIIRQAHQPNVSLVRMPRCSLPTLVCSDLTREFHIILFMFSNILARPISLGTILDSNRYHSALTRLLN